MKLSISNIAWSAEHDMEMYSYLNESGLQGVEIAPTRLFPEEPYKHIKEAKEFALMLKDNFDIEISSIQSIWFGKNENIFGTESDRNMLFEYTKRAIEFANAIDCKNLVFGCPRNRNIDSEESLPIAIDFFGKLAEYASKMSTVVAMEPNPTIYNTNFINTTEQAVDFCKTINNNGFMVNVDMGTIIQNNENIKIVHNNISLVNHIHISEPFLECIEKREIHKEIRDLNFEKYISIEMKNLNNISNVKAIIKYVKGVFN